MTIENLRHCVSLCTGFALSHSFAYLCCVQIWLSASLAIYHHFSFLICSLHSKGAKSSFVCLPSTVVWENIFSEALLSMKDLL